MGYYKPPWKPGGKEVLPYNIYHELVDLGYSGNQGMPHPAEPNYNLIRKKR